MPHLKNCALTLLDFLGILLNKAKAVNEKGKENQNKNEKPHPQFWLALP